MRPPTKAEIEAMHTAIDKTLEAHDASMLASDGRVTLELPHVEVDWEIFGVHDMEIEALRRQLEIWRNEPPVIPPRFVGLRPRRTRS